MNDSPPAPAVVEPLHPDPDIAQSLEFDPVPRRARVDGWSAEKQRAFIAALATTGSHHRAVKAVGMRVPSVVRLREGEGAESFSAAWDRAVAVAAGNRTSRLQSSVAAVTAAHGPRAPLPVVCDGCAAQGVAGEESFAGIADILAFDPAPSRGERAWDDERQRGFIAALAVTGSPRIAAKSVGRHVIGAEKLRKMRGGRGFAEAWEAALEIARERELMDMGDELCDLADQSGPSPGGRYGICINEFGEEEDEESLVRRGEEARASITNKLLGCRRLFLQEICIDPDKRAAWEVLCGPADWEKAAGFQPQDDEEHNRANMRQPDMVLTAGAGWMAMITDGEAGEARLQERVDRMYEGQEMGNE
jgi:hypothetical protein